MKTTLIPMCFENRKTLSVVIHPELLADQVPIQAEVKDNHVIISSAEESKRLKVTIEISWDSKSPPKGHYQLIFLQSKSTQQLTGPVSNFRTLEDDSIRFTVENFVDHREWTIDSPSPSSSSLTNKD